MAAPNDILDVSGSVQINNGALTLDADFIASYDAEPAFSSDNQVVTRKFVLDNVGGLAKMTVWLSPESARTDGTLGGEQRGSSILFVDSVVRIATWTFMMPADFASVDKVEVVWMTSAASGNMYWRIHAGFGASGEGFDNTLVTPAYGTTATAGTDLLGISTSPNVPDLSGLAIGDVLGVNVQRDATHANDTTNATARILGVLFTYNTL